MEIAMNKRAAYAVLAGVSGVFDATEINARRSDRRLDFNDQTR